MTGAEREEVADTLRAHADGERAYEESGRDHEEDEDYQVTDDLEEYLNPDQARLYWDAWHFVDAHLHHNDPIWLSSLEAAALVDEGWEPEYDRGDQVLA